MGVCFLGAAVDLVVGLIMVPVFWTLLALLIFGLYKSKRVPRNPLKQNAEPLMPLTPSPTPPTPVVHLFQKSSRSYFL